jgi:hypothetical protein
LSLWLLGVRIGRRVGEGIVTNGVGAGRFATECP